MLSVNEVQSGNLNNLLIHWYLIFIVDFFAGNLKRRNSLSRYRNKNLWKKKQKQKGRGPLLVGSALYAFHKQFLPNMEHNSRKGWHENQFSNMCKRVKEIILYIIYFYLLEVHVLWCSLNIALATYFLFQRPIRKQR